MQVQELLTSFCGNLLPHMPVCSLDKHWLTFYFALREPTLGDELCDHRQIQWPNRAFKFRVATCITQSSGFRWAGWQLWQRGGVVQPLSGGLMR